MGYEYDSPHWNEVVGKNWPAISDGDWRALETIARDAAEEIDPVEADRADRLFSDRVHGSESLGLAHEDMRSQQNRLRQLVDALVAAADTFGDMAELVHRTRHKILDILDRADADIRKVNNTAKADDDDDAVERRQRRIQAILDRARQEVEEVARAAADAVGPRTLPILPILAKLLGQQDPWPHGGRGANGHDGPGGRYPGDPTGRTDPAGGQHPNDRAGAGPDRAADPFGRIPLLPDLVRVDPRLIPHGSLDELMRRIGDRLLGLPDRIGVDAPSIDAPPPGIGQALPGPPGGGDVARPDPGHGMGWGPGGEPSAGAGAMHESGGGVDADPAADTSAGAQDSSAAGGPRDHLDAGPDHSGRSEHPSSDDGPAERRHEHSSDDDRHIPSVLSGPRGDRDAEHEPLGPAPAAPLMPGPMAGFGAPAAGPAVTPSVGAAPAASSGPAGIAPPSDTRVSAPVDGRPGAGGPRVPSGAVAGPGVAVPPPPVKPPPAGHGADGATNVVRDAVGGAMLAAASPGFVLGERVDGDLILARTLLSSLLAVLGAESSGVDAFGVGFAVAVLRHNGGISAFVTSNEGRGWLPTGLYLPRELSTPWVWSEAAGSAWEGLADPARVLAEFGLAWGSKTGARLTALVSSRPMDETLRGQLGSIPAEGEITAAAVMDFSGPSGGFVDRLELVGARPLLDRVRDTPPEHIAQRCLDLARDGMARIRAHGARLESLSAAAARDRIIDALGKRETIAGEQWDELRDADALIVASMLPLGADVSRVPLRELRSERDDRDGARAASLRAMVGERRCDELVLLLSAEPNRQTLRDAVYAHAQLVDQFPAAPIPSAGGGAAPPRRTSVTVAPPRQ